MGCQGKPPWALWGIRWAHIPSTVLFQPVVICSASRQPWLSTKFVSFPSHSCALSCWFSVFCFCFPCPFVAIRWLHLPVGLPSWGCMQHYWLYFHLPAPPPTWCYPPHTHTHTSWSERARQTKAAIWHICPGLAQFQWESLMLQSFKSHSHFPDLQSYRLPWLPSNSIRTKKASGVCCCLGPGGTSPRQGDDIRVIVLGPFPSCKAALFLLALWAQSAVKFLSLVGSNTSQRKALS